MSNPFGIPDEVFDAILVSAVGSAIKQQNNPCGMKKPNPDTKAPKQGTTPDEGAKSAKKIYDSYVAAGFNEIQAFELLKLVLSR